MKILPILRKKIKFKCRHLRVYGHKTLFTDSVSRKTVYAVQCKCGIKYMVDTLSKYPVHKVVRGRK